MKIINIHVGEEIYKIIQHTPTVNLYKILHMDEFFEVTRNNNNGVWKVLMQNSQTAVLPLHKIGEAIEENFMAVNQTNLQAVR